MVATREFTFLNQTATGKAFIPWNDPRFSKLWLYHLNYFDYLNVAFDLPREAPILEGALEIMRDWRHHNTQGTEVGWEPYPLSLRIVNWLKFLARHRRWLELSDSSRSSELADSIGVQTATLEHRLEKDLLGNHLLKNLKALLFAGALLECPSASRWSAEGETLLEHELNEQILPDGGHFERSPMYHSQVLEDLIDIRQLYTTTGKRLACFDLLSHKIQMMTEFLRGVLHPDGEIPLFNDSVLGGAGSPGELLDIAERPGEHGAPGKSSLITFPNTGYGAIRSPDSQSALVFDCGPLGPDYQPGHGHCDVLSYELSLRGQRVVVDSGVSTYESGPQRSYERSTAAHNTLLVDNQEQAEIWANFRVGRRPRTGEMRSGRTAGFLYMSGEHDAYRHRGVVHARTTVLCPPDTWIVADIVRGDGLHDVQGFLHFHPRVCVAKLSGDDQPNSPGSRWSLQFDRHNFVLATSAAGRWELLQSCYAEQFGMPQASAALCWTWQGTLPTGIIHVFAPAGTPLPRLVVDWFGKSLEIDGRKIPLR